MLLNNRVISLISSTLTDLSALLSDTANAGKAITLNPGDFLFVGSDLPFNHRFFLLGAPNAAPAVPSVDIWDGSATWNAAVDIQDLTSPLTATLAQSGIILWTPQRTKFWGREDKTDDIPQLSTLRIYNYYWARISFNAAVTFTLNYVGHRFAKDSDLNTYYGDLNRDEVRSAFYEDDSVANYDSVHVAAAEEVIVELRKRDVVWSPNQILDPDQFRAAAIHKMAHIVYSTFGTSHVDRRDEAYKQFQRAMNMLKFNVDRNADGRLEPYEKVTFSTLRRV